MSRVALALLTLVAAFPTFGQGIRGVTRRTSTQEFQAPARQFFDAAGININGTSPGAPAVAAPSMPGPRSAGMARPSSPGPLLSNKSGTAPVQARPYVLGNAPTPSIGTNQARLTGQLLNRAKSRTPLHPVPRPAARPAPPAPTPSPTAAPTGALQSALPKP